MWCVLDVGIALLLSLSVRLLVLVGKGRGAISKAVPTSEAWCFASEIPGGGLRQWVR